MMLLTQNMVNLVYNLNSSFVDDVINFETKLASINMTEEQGRKYSEYYSNIPLEDLYEKINDLKFLPEKLDKIGRAHV